MTTMFPIFTRTQTAESTPFDGPSLGLVSTNVQDAIRELASSGTSPLNFDYIELSAINIAEKKASLAKIPSSSAISVDVVGGTTQLLGADFSVSGRELQWDGLGLDGLLEEGDVLRVMYPSDYVDIEFHTFTSGEILSGEFELETQPIFPSLIMMDIVGGAPQYPGLDFSVVGRKIVFGGHSLQTLIEPGDVARIIYQSY